MSTKRRSDRQIIALLGALFFGAADAADRPRPPCDGPPLPAYPTSTSAPTVESQAVAGWKPPACLDWDGAGPNSLVVVVARILESSGPEALLARFGAVSQLTAVRYWSVTDQAWRSLILDAFTVTDATGTSRREDFHLEELKSSLPLYFAQRDGRSSGIVIYRMHVIAHTSERIAVSVVNVSPVRTFGITLFRPGELQATYFLDRLGTDQWGYFGLWGVTSGVLTGGHAASSINRAVALFRHFVGIPSSQEPPAARHGQDK